MAIMLFLAVMYGVFRLGQSSKTPPKQERPREEAQVSFDEEDGQEEEKVDRKVVAFKVRNGRKVWSERTLH